MPFKPGNNANPAGGAHARAKKVRQLKEMLAGDVPAALKAIRECLEDPMTKLAAAREILDRVFGRPGQAVELTGKDGGPLEFTHLVDRPAQETPEEWQKRVQQQLEAKARQSIIQ